MTDQEQFSRPDAGTRLGSMALDHFIMSAVAGMFGGASLLGSLFGMFEMMKPSHHLQDKLPFDFGLMITFYAIGFGIYLAKDSVQGRSLGKRITKLVVLNNSTREVAGPWRCLVRNLFAFLWPIEVILALANPSRRLGDMAAGTCVAKWDPEMETPKIDWLQSLGAVAIMCTCLVLLSMPLQNLLDKIPTSFNEVEESSYNPNLSIKIQTRLSEELGDFATPDVRAYDQMLDKDMPFISLIFSIKEGIGTYDQVQRIKDTTQEVLDELITTDDYKGRIQITSDLGLMDSNEISYLSRINSYDLVE
ncbi:MAG: RDD family protein [Bacteroidia bacterium]|nr:RDD family protein [Bacteroidia bacterium]